MPQNNQPGHAPLDGPAPTETYAAAYARLTALAEKLKSGGVTSIDTLVQDIKAAKMAHQALQQRLRAVRAEIDAELAAASDEADRSA